MCGGEVRASADNSGSGTVGIWGTFKPIGGKFYGPVLQDGATLDVSEWTGTFPLSSTSSAGATSVSFADGATTINAKFGGRQVSGRQPIVAWTAETKPTGITFQKLDGDRPYKLEAKDDGLHAIQKGLTISVF